MFIGQALDDVGDVVSRIDDVDDVNNLFNRRSSAMMT